MRDHIHRRAFVAALAAAGTAGLAGCGEPVEEEDEPGGGPEAEEEEEPGAGGPGATEEPPGAADNETEGTEDEEDSA